MFAEMSSSSVGPATLSALRSPTCSLISREAGKEDFTEPRYLLVLIDVTDFLFIRADGKAAGWLQTIINEVYYILGIASIWTSRQDVVIDISRLNSPRSDSIARALERLGRVRVIRDSTFSLKDAVDEHSKCTALHQAKQIVFLGLDLQGDEKIQEFSASLIYKHDTIERAFHFQLPTRRMESNLRCRQSLEIKEIDLSSVKEEAAQDANGAACFPSTSSEAAKGEDFPGGKEQVTDLKVSTYHPQSPTIPPKDSTVETGEDSWYTIRNATTSPILLPRSGSLNSISSLSQVINPPVGQLAPAKSKKTDNAVSLKQFETDTSEPLPIVISVYQGYSQMRSTWGKLPCYNLHLSGLCLLKECTRLHQEISFTPEALVSLRQEAAKEPCKRGKDCRFQTGGKCWKSHPAPEAKLLSSPKTNSGLEGTSRKVEGYKGRASGSDRVMLTKQEYGIIRNSRWAANKPK